MDNLFRITENNFKTKTNCLGNIDFLELLINCSVELIQEINLKNNKFNRK